MIKSEIPGEEALYSENQQLKLLEIVPSMQQPCYKYNACDKSWNFPLYVWNRPKSATARINQMAR